MGSSRILPKSTRLNTSRNRKVIVFYQRSGRQSSPASQPLFWGVGSSKLAASSIQAPCGVVGAHPASSIQYLRKFPSIVYITGKSRWQSTMFDFQKMTCLNIRNPNSACDAMQENHLEKSGALPTPGITVKEIEMTDTRLICASMWYFEILLKSR